MRLLVCGGRDYTNKEYLYGCLDKFKETRGIDTIISGKAKGADTLAEQYAFDRNIMFVGYRADFARLGKKAGPLRNIQMLKEGLPDCIMAFPGGKGTAHMIKIAKEANIEVVEC